MDDIKSSDQELGVVIKQMGWGDGDQRLDIGIGYQSWNEI